jgi:hypothetical protein
MFVIDPSGRNNAISAEERKESGVGPMYIITARVVGCTINAMVR